MSKQLKSYEGAAPVYRTCPLLLKYGNRTTHNRTYKMALRRSLYTYSIMDTFQMNKGFTLIEILVAGLIILTLALGVIGFLSGGKISEQQLCQGYRYSTVQDMPVMCLKYFK